MSEETKEAVRLLFECMDELRLHDEEYKHKTSKSLKERLKEYLVRNGIGDPLIAAQVLCTAE